MAEWFSKGLKFECTKCGDCCRGEPGYVWVSGAELVAIAGLIGWSLDVLEARFVRRVGDRMSICEKPNGDCAFWENGIGCRIYPVRPIQCRTFPFWKENISSRRQWDKLGTKCPGVGRGKVHRADDIRKKAGNTW